MGRAFPVPFNQAWSSQVCVTHPLCLSFSLMALNFWCRAPGGCGCDWRGGRSRYPISTPIASSLCPPGVIPKLGSPAGTVLVGSCREIFIWGGLGASLMRPRDGLLWGWIGPASLIPVNKGKEAKLKRDSFLEAAGSSCFLSPSLNTVFSSNEGAIQSNNETLLTSQCFKCHFLFPR